MNYGTIKSYDIANGTGVRVSLFVSGCRHHCKGCFNAPTWDFDYGEPFTRETQDKILKLLEPSYIEGFSLLGGEPFEPENQPVLAQLLETIKAAYPQKTVWCYSGYLFDQDMVPGGKVYTPFTDRMLSCIDVLVDGEFILEQKDISLQFRGSKNQRILHLENGDLQEFDGTYSEYRCSILREKLALKLQNIEEQEEIARTQELVDEVLHTLYFNDPNGLSGNEDCGQMSAWYILNAMGFYQVCPGKPVYSIGRPLFNKATIHLKDGKTFTILAHNNSRENKYVQKMVLNGKELKTPFFAHQDIVDGGTLELTMGGNPLK